MAHAQPDDSPIERRVTILGATGSIGASTVDVVKHEPDLYRVEAVASGGNVAQLAQLAREVDAQFAAVADPNAYQDLKAALSGSGIEAAAGPAAVVEAACRPADLIMAAISGANGLAPTLAALDQGSTVALANKECLVCAGHLFMRTAAASNAAAPMRKTLRAPAPADKVDHSHQISSAAIPKNSVKGTPPHQATPSAIGASTAAETLRTTRSLPLFGPCSPSPAW